MSIPTYASSGYFNAAVTELLNKKFDEKFVYEIHYDSDITLEKILNQEDEITSAELTFFSRLTHSFKVAVTINEGSYELFGKYKAFLEIPVTNRVIRPGHVLTINDLKIIKSQQKKDELDIVTNISNLIGMQVKQLIPSGHFIRNFDIRKPPLVKENELVTILYESEHMSLKTTGMALSAGAVGEIIKVKNQKTGIIIFGEIIDKTLVKVGPNAKN